MITAQKAAEKWNIHVRRVQEYCKQGKIPGAQRFGTHWMVPADAIKPADGRRKVTKEAPRETLSMPRKTPMLVMTNLYHTPGSAEAASKELARNPEAQKLFDAEIAYCRGDIDAVYQYAQYFLDHHTGLYAVLGAGMLLAYCAVWRGDVNLWNKAKLHIASAPFKTDADIDAIALTNVLVDSTALNSGRFPEWFERGCFERLPFDSYPAAKVYYGKMLYMAGYAVASKQWELEGIHGLALMRIIPNTLEPMIAQARADSTTIVEIHLRMLCAIAYHYTGRDELANEYTDRAIALALPDKLYGILAEYRRPFERMLDERLTRISPEAARKVAALYNQYHKGISTLSGIVRNRYIATNLTAREREVAKLISFGLTAKEIADRLHISESTVKQATLIIKQKTGINKRTEFAYIL